MKTTLKKLSTSQVLGNVIVWIFVAIFILFLTGVYFFYIREKGRFFEETKQAQVIFIQNQDNLIKSNLDLIFADVVFLSKISAVQNYIENPSEKTHAELENDLLDFIQYHSVFDHVRFIDLSGQEIVRANYNAGDSNITPHDQLQNRKDRYYFLEILKLPPNTFYRSAFDLNVEFGKVEVPHKPVIRIGTLLYNSKNEKVGALVVNYLGNTLFQALAKSPLPNPATSFSMINADGYFLKGIKEEDEWGFILPERANKIATALLPNLKLCKDDALRCDYYTKEGLYTYKTLIFRNTIQGAQVKNTDPYWYLISYIPSSFFIKHNRKIALDLLLLVLVVASFWFSLAFCIEFVFLKRQEHIQLLSDLSEKKSTFVGNVAHEFKNPLSIIRQYLELIEEELDPTTDKEKVTLLQQGRKTVDRLNRLVHNLLDVTKIETGKVELKKEQFDFGPVLSEVLLEQDLDIQKKKITVNQEIAPDLCSVYADKDKIIEVLINLLSNAIKYTPENGAITVKAKCTPRVFIFSITNSGKGLSPEQIKVMFNKFERLGAEKEEGTGLGLPIAEEIVRLHGGSLTVGSELNHSTTFTLELPLQNPPTNKERQHYG